MQEQFFSVTHATPVNVILLPDDYLLPSEQALEAELPEPFRIAAAISSIDMATTRLIRSQNDAMQDLVEPGSLIPGGTRSVKLESQLGRPVYVVDAVPGRMLFDARSGELLSPIDEAGARARALRCRRARARNGADAGVVLRAPPRARARRRRSRAAAHDP